MRILDLGCGPREHFESNWGNAEFLAAISGAAQEPLGNYSVLGIDKNPTPSADIRNCADPHLQHFNDGFSAALNVIKGQFDIALYLNPSADRETMAYIQEDAQQLRVMQTDNTAEKVSNLVHKALKPSGLLLAVTDLPQAEAVLKDVTSGLQLIRESSVSTTGWSCYGRPTASGVWRKTA